MIDQDQNQKLQQTSVFPPFHYKVNLKVGLYAKFTDIQLHFKQYDVIDL